MLSLYSIFYLFHDVCFAALLLVLSLKWKLIRPKSEKTKATVYSLVLFGVVWVSNA